MNVLLGKRNFHIMFFKLCKYLIIQFTSQNLLAGRYILKFRPSQKIKTAVAKPFKKNVSF